ncbi:tyrosine-protein phosphatase [Thiothrix winogradskyi]|uniref:Tyrosine-protein phosphatase n=1 Tax=Thiothrix winogradskyi TaxID=96472 RepID=A0ABY3T406_9GAMM|nr:tyrosine-protein phosphatase [Thiothrix winogradskyi]UJS26344.1 tyrosine-protein phosphatase [Thiothrix winogradskyi]
MLITLLRRTLFGGLSMLAILIAILAGAYWVVEYDGNFHAVVPDVVYRSAQLDGEQLQQAIASHHIKSILNLRGGNPGKPWYDDEVAVSKTYQVAHLDYALSAGRMLSANQMREILDLIEKSPKPLLIHCRAGADRTGLVSALYLASHGYAEQDIRQQLSARFGHVPWAIWDETIAMDNSLDNFLLGH